MYLIFRIHFCRDGPNTRNVLEISYTFQPNPADSAHCTRNFIHICPFSPPNTPINTKFHIHFSRYRQHLPIILEISYRFPLIPALRANGTRFFVLITLAPSARSRKKDKKRPLPRKRSLLTWSKKLLDRSGEKPYCTFIICIRFHSVNNFF